MRLRELGCAVRLVQLIGSGKETEAKISPEELDRIAGYADAIGPSLRLLIDARGQTVDGNALVTDAHARGLTVHVWTLRADSLPPFTDDFAALARRVLFDLGADGVFTDHPDLAVRAIRKPPDR
jgi:glycerophosphoryl diester phosphodiesterase